MNPGAGDWPLTDHHLHGVVRRDLDRDGFEQLISESGQAPPPGTSHFDSPIGLAVRRHCAPLLELDEHATPDRYLERRAALGWREVSRRFLSAAGVDQLLVDTGHRTDEVTGPAELGALAGAPAAEVVRVEAVAEAAAMEAGSAAEWCARFPARLREASAAAVALKTIVAYRHGLDLDPDRPTRTELTAALGAWFSHLEKGRVRLDHPVVLRQVLHEALDVAVEQRLVIQVHSGFGDSDLDLHRADPVRFTPFVRRAGAAGVDLVFLHCYPYQRQAGYLAEVFPNVYFDVGCALNYTGAGAGRVLAEALEMGPFTKQLYSSDAFGLPELVYLGAVQFRRHFSSVVGGWVAGGDCTPADADRIRDMISTQTARRIYPLTPAHPPRS
ncbi:MAG TPA: amidohydrolase family protein [Acidimicrobiales bacterium]|nr:amidohydrolase family protein [Acidimicrobiales bacterium]